MAVITATTTVDASAAAEAALPAMPALPDRPSFTIAEAAEMVGITDHTLRYYERIGLLDVPRDHAGRRCYRAEDIARAVFITRLRVADMPIARIQRYFELVEEGPHTEPERLALLEEHRAEVLQRLDNLQIALASIDYKIQRYGGSLSEDSCGPVHQLVAEQMRAAEQLTAG
jgi:DNA-binding transcriptional MerR regulator